MRIGTHLAGGGVPLGELQDEAAARGLDSLWANQQPGGMDPFGVLLALGDGPAELGTAIVPTYPQHPVVMATSALTVQSLTGGRLTLGIGPSHATFITGQLGLPYASPARHTREYLEVLRPLLRGEHVKYAGDFFTVDAQLAIDVTTPPPVLVSALGPRMLEVARDLADGTIAVWTRPATVAGYLIPRLAEGARVVAAVMTSVSSDPDGVREAIARDYGIINDLPAYRAMLDRGGLSGPADTVVAGDEATVLRELAEYRDAGVTDLIVTPLGSRAEQGRTLDVVAQLDR
ncbi:TIGR03564 family F420-dependent LLM class oxidoreductase [Amycolatopsis saalfeldensis]|uniref:F420-dependent oxidoreductase, MSMEG_4879 family n=1 Tax=Amycolatopsis saalfeldensis TaxID=394193 RepID=A0A1H8YFF0_9PSEU|nr:TIGR03564 family F420-dependent LLM class oxidoreductase [Amycolatopsis saalfeldensis]SEP50188.1 F420-dependent oxidoreductase, MSMEG_4879 family [Amycolatopsis saalfeldensis]